MAVTKVRGNAVADGTNSTTVTVTMLGSSTSGNLLVAVFGGRDADNSTVASVSSVSSGWTLIDVTAPMERHIAGMAWRVADGTTTDDTCEVTFVESTGSRWIGLAEFALTGVSDWVIDKQSWNGSNASNVSSIATGSTGTLSASAGVAVVVGTSRTGSAGLSISGVGTLLDLSTLDAQFASTDAGSANFIADAVDITATTALDATVSESSGASRMGAGIVVFVEAGGAIDLVVADATVATTIDTVTLDVPGNLVVADLSVATTIDTVTLTQVHELVVADLAVATTIDTVTLTGPDEFTTDFPGTSLPTEWTEELPQSVGSTAVADSRLAITIPSGTARDSISSVGSADNSIGVVATLNDHGGDIDVAVQLDDDISDLVGIGVNLLFKGSGTDAFRFAHFRSTGTNAEGACSHYCYARASGVGAQIGTSGTYRNFSPSLMTGTPSWMRVTYTSSSGEWNAYFSTDGANWELVKTGTRSFTPTTCKIGVTTSNGASSLGGTFYVNKVVDLLSFGSTDLRDDLPATLYRNETSEIDPTVDSSLPGTWSDDSAGTSSVSIVDGGTASGVIRFSHDASEDADVGATARMRFTGTAVENFGILVAASNPTGNASCYFTIGAGAFDTDWIDQYVVGRGYGLEVQSGPIRRPIQIDDPSNNAAYPTPGSTGLDETPYHWMKTYGSEYNFRDGGTRWWRIERFGRRVRYREWADGDTEPSTWSLYDGQNEQNDVAVTPALSLSHNGTQTGTCTVDVEYLQIYEVSETPAATDLVVADLAVASTVDTIALTQTHELVVADATVGTTVDTVVLAQVHSLTVADATVATTIDTVTLTQVHNLTVAAATVATSIDTVTLEVQGDLVVADLTVPVTIDTVALTQTHELVVADLSVGSSIDTVTITVGGIDLSVASLTVDTTIDTLALTQVHNLAVADLAVSSTVDTVTVTQTHELLVADLAVGSTIDAVTLTGDDVDVPFTGRFAVVAHRQPVGVVGYRRAVTVIGGPS